MYAEFGFDSNLENDIKLFANDLSFIIDKSILEKVLLNLENFFDKNPTIKKIPLFIYFKQSIKYFPNKIILTYKLFSKFYIEIEHFLNFPGVKENEFILTSLNILSGQIEKW